MTTRCRRSTRWSTSRPQDVRRWLGIELTPQRDRRAAQPAGVRRARSTGETVRADTPITAWISAQGVIGVADLMEEIARIYGYERIPETRMADELPPQRSNPALEQEERMRDLLVGLGLQEVITYRMTTPEREARRLPPGTAGPADRTLRAPGQPDRRRPGRACATACSPACWRWSSATPACATRMALFEIGPVFTCAPRTGELPDEPPAPGDRPDRAAGLPAWQGADSSRWISSI